MSLCLWIFHLPWHRHHFSPRASIPPCANILPSVQHCILYHSCFCKELSLLEPCEVFEDWGHTLAILALSVPNRGAEKKLVIEGSKTFITSHKYSVPMHSCSHRLIHRGSMNRACCFPFSLFSVPRTDNRPVDH